MSDFAFRKGRSAERINSAAVRYKGEVYTGKGHPFIYDDIERKHGHWPKEGEYEDGFVTSKGRFVNRMDAAKVAKLPKRTWVQDHGGPQGLHSTQVDADTGKAHKDEDDLWL